MYRPLVTAVTLRHLRIASVSLASLAVSACAGGTDMLGQQEPLAAKSSETSVAAAGTQTELEKATSYWSKEYSKNPRDIKTVLSYAKNLKAGGHKERALVIFQEGTIYHGSNREFSSEYGRLALELGQANLAMKLLEAADDPGNPDWRVISALGTVHAKQGNYAQAIPFYERAQAIAPDASSVLSNLAMAYAATGRADEAEPLLRRAIEIDGSNGKLKQNLALVMGLQGKHDDARQVEGQDVGAEHAAANADLVRKFVKTSAPADAVPAQLASASASGPAKAKGSKKAASDLRQGTDDNAATPDWDKLVAQAIAKSDDGKAGNSKPKKAKAAQ